MMKRIIYTQADGSLTILAPHEGARFAHSVTVNGMTVKADPDPSPVDTMLRAWPVAGAIAEWAESEDLFVGRIRDKDVPPTCIASAQIVDASVIPADRSKRKAWRQNGAAVVVDLIISAQIDAENARVAADEIERANLKESGPLMAFVNMTPAEIAAWITANVNNLADAKLALALLAKIVNVAVRKFVRSGVNEIR